jgi:hypothetical protein
MYGRVIGMRYDDWKAWHTAKAQQIKQAQAEAAKQRAQLEGSQTGTQ